MSKAMRKKAAAVGGNAILMPVISEPGAVANVAATLLNTDMGRAGTLLALRIVDTRPTPVCRADPVPEPCHQP